MERKELGRIVSATFGFGGYQDAMFGLAVKLGGESWGVNDFTGGWATRSERAQYSMDEWRETHVQSIERLRDVLSAAKKQTVDELANTLVEVTLEGNTLKSWRVLTEVL